jgi:hypothetical protein
MRFLIYCEELTVRFKVRRSGYAIANPTYQTLYTSVTKPVIPAGIAGIQPTWMYLSSPSMAQDTLVTRFPAGMTNYLRICV